MKKENHWCIYKHTNKINGKVYIGQTGQNPKLRWENGKGYKNCVLFNRAIQKYGWDNFEHEILADNLTLDEANELELKFILLYDSVNPLKGYNIKCGGQNSPQSETTKKKISQSEKGKIVSEETKEKIRRNHKNNSGELSPNWGKHFSEDIRKRMSESHLGKKHPMSEETKRKIGNPVCCIETNQIYHTATEAGKENNCDPSHIIKCCRGKAKTCGGYHWKYIK